MFKQFISRYKTLFVILGLSFSSGVPFLLLLSTLSVWLAESGVSKTIIGLFAVATLPYSIKFLWAPVIDAVELPFLKRFLGQRRSWLFCSQFALLISLVLLGRSEPSADLLSMGGFALLLGFCSATQDIVIEAYRIEALSKTQIAKGVSCSVLGYRLGMLFSGAGALYLADFFQSWFLTYTLMGSGIVVGIIATCFACEPERAASHLKKGAFLSFFKQSHWSIIFLFIVLYKIGDTTLNAMSMPFLLELGFSKTEIAQVAKTFGISAMILGAMVGGAILSRWPLSKGLCISLGLQLLAAGLFIIQSRVGHRMDWLYLTMGIENLACGISQVMLIAYLSEFCIKPHSGTHYAILSSFSSSSRVGLTVLAGWLADRMLWFEFYSLIGCACLPALFLMLLVKGHFRQTQIEVQPV